MNNITFIDIETIPETEAPLFDSFKWQLFKKKNKEVIDKMDASGSSVEAYIELWKSKAALYVEFGKIVAVSIGKMHGTKFHVKSIVSRFENKLLEQLTLDLVKSNGKTLCGHNSMEFDFPFLNRRYTINQLP